MAQVNFNKLDFRKVDPIKLPFAEKYIYDIDYIFFADTGIWDARQTNIFFQEAGKMLINAINLFCDGYFDCAFYSLRQSYEISVTSLYLNENKDDIEKWNKKQKGFEQHTMVKSLKDQFNDYQELREGLLKPYFDKLRIIMENMNKYIHKQGFSTMYTTRYSFEGRKAYKEEKLVDFFTYCLKACIGAVAVWRIILDPMPVLLNDETIARKTREMCPEPYSDEFIEMYIGQEAIENYKKSTLYQEYYKYFNQFEEQNEAIFNIIHYQYINKNDFEDILKQIHLLTIQDRIAVLFMLASEHIVRVIFRKGIFCYTSNINLRGNDSSIIYENGAYSDFFEKGDINQIYKGGFISRFSFADEYVLVIHNELFADNELTTFNLINEQLAELLKKENDQLQKQIDAYILSNK
ncbi:MAG: hypothetical protein LKI39_16425 [Bacteroides sp.]|jgi:hypothetical protein|nr:hypothetical protein [Bacteroides sp.]MCI1684116.1 hypothetical protein [Bacteroides sp.]